MFWHFWVYFYIYFKVLSGKNNQKVNKQKIWDSQNWVSDELNEIMEIILVRMWTNTTLPIRIPVKISFLEKLVTYETFHSHKKEQFWLEFLLGCFGLKTRAIIKISYEVSFFFEILMITLVSSLKQPFYSILHTTVILVRIPISKTDDFTYCPQFYWAEKSPTWLVVKFENGPIFYLPIVKTIRLVVKR